MTWPPPARRAWIIAVCVLAAAYETAHAQDADPPGRAARLSDAEGSVSLQPAGVQDWASAPVNRPLSTGDRLWSDEGARAELDLGTAAIRLGSNTGFAFLNLDDRTVQMQLSAGALIVSVRDLPSGETYEVDTPNIALSVQQPGVYRVEVNEQGSATAVAVSQGAAQALGGGQSVAIGSQQLVTFTGVDRLAWQSATLGAPDKFDDWSALRERQAAQSDSSGYVASDIPGTPDLDKNGEWQQTPEYGYVWVPTIVAAGWVPYRYGQWVWVTPWGWTWIDAAPWGYAPFHYGRWVVWNHSWCWVPAPRHGGTGRAVYAPALVAWVGAVPGGGSVAMTHVGWFPLGPREVYVPPYRVSAAYVRNINIANTTSSDNASTANQNTVPPPHYVNRTADAVTLVPRGTFISGERIGSRTVRVSAAELATATVTPAPLLVPTRQSVLGATAARRVARPPGALMQRTVIARSQPPPAPVPFERQLSAIEADGGQPPTRSELARLQHGASLTPVKLVSSNPAPPAHPVAPQQAPTKTLAERARVLQQSAFPSAPKTDLPPATPGGSASAARAPAEITSSSMPALRSDRPPAVDQHPAETGQRAIRPDERSSPAADREAALPVFQFPPSAAPAPPAPAAPRTAEGNRVPASTAARPPATPQAPARAATPPAASTPTHPPSVKEPRDSAAHGERDSRERAVR